VPAATPEETEKVLRWLEAPGVRIVSLEGEWTCPVHGAGAARARLEPLAAAPRDAVGFDQPGSPSIAGTGPHIGPRRRSAPVALTTAG
jgi:DNA polymerase-3 subunit epsilon